MEPSGDPVTLSNAETFPKLPCAQGQPLGAGGPGRHRLFLAKMSQAFHGGEEPGAPTAW